MPSPELSPDLHALQREFELLREQLREEFREFAARLKAMELQLQGEGCNKKEESLPGASKTEDGICSLGTKFEP